MFKPSLLPGLTHEATLEITEALTVPQVSRQLPAFAGMPPVFATAFMVAFMEATCVECLLDHLDEDVHTVGVHVDVYHTAATPVGMTVRTFVELRSIENRTLTFDVRSEDEAGVIGEGTHARALIRPGPFMERVNRRRTDARTMRVPV